MYNPFKRVPTIPVIRLSGMITPQSGFRSSLSIQSAASVIDRAFKAVDRNKTLALVINSPGGAPVQAHLIFRRIRALAEENEVKVIAFVEDVAASGGYMIALAADEIYADPSSIVGSIGVISAGFGFHNAIDRVGVERRVYTAGKTKSKLDPFRPEDPEDVAWLRGVQDQIHEIFKDMVRQRREGRLNGDEADLFEGQVWVGAKGVDAGLIDGIADVRTKLREMFGDKTRLKVVTRREGLFRRPSSGVHDAPAGLAIERVAAEAVDGVFAGLEERAVWARYGL